jgi:uncharacterized protein YeaO (DUF488 family)
MIKTKRIYEPVAKNDGVRVLVDRLWPRGIKKEDAQIDMWLKAIAPSNELRNWYDGENVTWEDFRDRYFNELDSWGELLVPVFQFLEKDHGTVTLLFAKKDEERNNAVALREFLQKKM